MKTLVSVLLKTLAPIGCFGKWSLFFLFLVNGLKCASQAYGPLRSLCLDHIGVPWIYNSGDTGFASGATIVVVFLAEKQIV